MKKKTAKIVTTKNRKSLPPASSDGKPQRVERPDLVEKHGNPQNPVLDDWQTPAPMADKSQREEIPDALKRFNVPPEQAIRESLAQVLDDPKARPIIAGFFSGLGFDFGVPLPAWVRESSKGFWASLGLDFIPQNPQDLSMRHFGKLWGLMEHAATDKNFRPEWVPAIEALRHVLSKAINAAPPEEAIEFHTGRLSSKIIVGKMESLPNRTKIFLMLVIHWPEVREFKSQGKLWEWLIAQQKTDGRDIVTRSTDSREVRKVCKLVGLRYR